MNICSAENCSNGAATKGMCHKHYQASRRNIYRNPELPKNFRHTDGTRQQFGKNAEVAVAGLLRSYARRVDVMGYYDPFDLLVDGKWRCEVKGATPINKGNAGALSWFFNLHRHGQLAESGVDLYILRFDLIPGHKNAVHLLFKAPLKILTLSFTLRSLIETAAPHVSDFKLFCKGEFGI